MGEWKVKSIVGLCLMGRGRVISQFELDNDGDYPVFSSQSTNNGEMGKLNTYDFNGEYVTWTTDGANAGTVFYRNGKFNCTNVCGTLLSKGDIDMQFLAYQFGIRAKKYVSYIGNPKLMNNIVAKIPIYFPVLANEQRRIAAVLTAADEAIAASRALVEKYAAVKQGLMRDLLTGNGSLNRFSEIADPISRKGNANGRICINMDCVESGTGELLPIVDAENSSAKTEFVAGDVLFGKLRPYLRKYWLATFDGVCSSELMVFRAKPNIRRQYLYYIVSSNAFIEYNNSQTYGTKMPRTSWSIIKQYKTNVPNISEQDRVIEVLSAADERLATERKRLMKLEYIKRGLMDDLLTNRVSTDKLQGGI